MTELIAIVAVVIVAWFATGTIWNIRKGNELMRWMQDGLPLLGARTTVRWLGSTAVELVIRDGKEPFAGTTLIVFMEARDMPWMWAFGRLSGRRDMLIIRGVFRHAPAVEFEVLRPGSWSSRDALPRVPVGWLEKAEPSVVVRYAEAGALERAQALLALTERAGVTVQRLSVRRTEPNFQLHIAMPDQRQAAHGLFEAVRAIAEGAIA